MKMPGKHAKRLSGPGKGPECMSLQAEEGDGPGAITCTDNKGTLTPPCCPSPLSFMNTCRDLGAHMLPCLGGISNSGYWKG